MKKRVRIYVVLTFLTVIYYLYICTLSLKIYQDGKLSHYLDASDENTSSWMRFIRCARYREEQNLFSFQYCGNIYYRAFREISVGAELLVWYDEKYPQDMGIPLEVQDMALVDPNGMSKQ